jgi:uncharacterized protein DUF4178
MNLKVRDVLSFAGRDYVVEGTATYRLGGGRTSVLARAVDGERVAWVEPPSDVAIAGDGVTSVSLDRFVWLEEVRDLDLAVPPSLGISYRSDSYIRRSSARGTLELSGAVPERVAGPIDVWRYRGAADRVLQVEASADRVFKLAGETVHPGLIDILPGR